MDHRWTRRRIRDVRESSRRKPSHRPSYRHGKRYKMKPTVKAAAGFDAKKDADALYKAFKGIGADEESVIAILGRRSNEQRVEIAKKYKEAHGKDLDDVMKSELKGDFEALAVASIRPHHEFLARELHDAISGLGTKEEAIAEILGVSDNKTIHKINESYQKLYDTTLEKALKKDTSGCLERLFVLLSLGNRNESDSYDAPEAHNDAVKLWNSGEARLGTDEDLFVEILSLRSRPHLRAMFKDYKVISGHEFSDAVEKEFKGGSEKALVTLVYAIESPVKFLAHRLRDATEGFGTRDKDLIRVVLWRSEIDMGDIKDYYVQKFGKSLPDVIDKEATGDYKNMLQALID